MEETSKLLIAQMKRSIELMQGEMDPYSKEVAELSNKLHEIRRDSIRLMKLAKPWIR